MENLNSSSLFDTLGSTLAPFGGIALVLGLLWIIWSTQSFHALRFRVWRLLVGQAEIVDPDVKRFVDDRNALMSFRFLSGMKAYTIVDARRMARWLHEQDIEIRSVSAAGPYFDTRTLTVKVRELPARMGQFWIVVSSAVLFALGGCFAKPAEYDYAFLRVISTNSWYGVDAKGFARIDWRGKRGESLQTVDQCKKQPTEKGKQKDSESENIQVLCELITHPEGSAFLANAIRGQRAALVTVVLVFLLLGLGVLRRIPQACAAIELHKKLKRAKQALPALPQVVDESS